MVSPLLHDSDITDASALPCMFLAHHEPESFCIIIAVAILALLTS